MTDTFDLPRDGSGTHEWAEHTENIARGCPHNCLYCYAATNAQRFKLRARDNWAEEVLTKKASLTSYPKKDGVVMFPSAHDITPFNIEAYLRVAKLRTSISAEPLLGGLATARTLCDAVRPYVTDTIWIGKMNKIRNRVDLSIPENLARAIEIEAAQTDAEVLRLHAALKDDPLVRWKDSIDEVLVRTAAA